MKYIIKIETTRVLKNEREFDWYMEDLMKAGIPINKKDLLIYGEYRFENKSCEEDVATVYKLNREPEETV